MNNDRACIVDVAINKQTVGYVLFKGENSLTLGSLLVFQVGSFYFFFFFSFSSFFFSSRRRHTRCSRDWSSDVCSSDLFIDPVLDLDLGLLEQHLEDTRDRKDKLLVDAGIEDKKDLMSNPKFADMLRDLGVIPPMKDRKSVV